MRKWVELAERVRARSVSDPVTGCLVWGGAKSDDGYGQIWHGPDKRLYLTHRVMCAAHHGEIPQGGMACHNCDNPSCCNPDHLYIGDVRTNAADMASRKRGYLQKNPDRVRDLASMGGRACAGKNLFRNGISVSAKLVVEQVKEIRTSALRSRDLAAKFGVSRKTVEAVRRGKTWQTV